MTTEALLDLLNAGRILEPGTPESMGMNDISVRAREICALINQESSDVPRIGELFSELIGEPVPEGFRLLASRENCRVQMLAHESRPIFGTQFHPELQNDAHRDGQRILENFFAYYVK